MKFLTTREIIPLVVRNFIPTLAIGQESYNMVHVIVELNPYENHRDQQDKNQLHLKHDATIQSALRTTLGCTNESEMLEIKLEDQEIVDKIKIESGMESKPDLISKKKTKKIPKKGKWLVKLYKLLKCENCSKHFENGKYLQNHRSNCFSQANNDQLKQNEENELQENETTKVVRCDQCNKVFACKKYMNKHQEIIHLKVRHKCNQCEKDFGTKGYLNKHIRGFHEKLTIQCDKCEKTFPENYNLKKHKESSHLGIKYDCNKCKKTFSHKVSLDRHIKHVHEGKSYRCDKCDNEFTYPQMLKMHIRAKHEKLIYSCTMCSETFSYYTSLDRHFASVHKGVK